MPFCPKCRDEFQDWVKTCPDCKVELVEILPPLPEKPSSITPLSPPPEPMEALLTVATYNYPIEAHLAVAKLQSEGIWAFVADEHIINANWLYSIAVGGVKVRVNETDVEKAMQILRTNVQDSMDRANDEILCPKCKSYNVKYEKLNLRLVFGLWFVSFLFLGGFTGGGITLPFFKRKWKCNTCGYQWKNRPS